MAPGAAFFFKALSPNLALRLTPPSGVAVGRSAEPPSRRRWAVSLSASLGDSSSRSLTVGVSDRLQRALPLGLPPAGEPAAVELTLIGAGGGRAAGELRPMTGGEEVWEFEATTRAPGAVTLSWPSLLRELPPGMVLVLEDQVSGRSTLLNTRGSYRYDAQGPAPRRFRLVARSGRIERATITSMTPVPTRGRGLGLSLTVSGPAEIQVVVRGLGGRVVKELRRSADAAGTLEIGWDQTDQQGRPVPAGTYLVEATARSENGALNRATRTVRVE